MLSTDFDAGKSPEDIAWDLVVEGDGRVMAIYFTSWSTVKAPTLDEHGKPATVRPSQAAFRRAPESEQPDTGTAQ